MACCLFVATILSGLMALRKAFCFLRSKHSPQEWRLIQSKED
jgi:hypothetical protein